MVLGRWEIHSFQDFNTSSGTSVSKAMRRFHRDCRKIFGGIIAGAKRPSMLKTWAVTKAITLEILVGQCTGVEM